ncbi:BTAD domain-containing putative transcriptional regulator [Promicromonospora vindobonensis]|uniref:BTAD domain-containing putative transcriptional regulator n=1 Tax=Promicromonospora vindobonensis TaxID=195748 RepID=A0ABW5VZV9_9MICO
MRVRILGPVEISDGRAWYPVTGRGGAVLGSLVARAPRPVTVDEIIDDVWEGRAPKSAPTQVYGSVHKLRQVLHDGDDGAALRRSDKGYLLSVGPLGVDAGRFTSGVEAGLDMFRTGRLEESAEALGEALSVWRGDPFDGLPPGGAATALSLRLENLRATAVQHRLEARIECGEHADVIGELHEQVDRHPFREDLWRHLLVALYRSGREAEALQEYGRLRQTLTDELGTDPSRTTQAVYQQILDRKLPPATSSAGAVTTAQAPAPSDPPDPEPTPATPVRQLPPGVADFAGRTREMLALESFVDEHDSPDAPLVVVVNGAPGTGKSTLAVHLARSVRHRYPDTQLYLDLAGTSPSPREPDELLATMLHSLGRFGHPLPGSVAARSALLRSMLAERRTLLVLDDAATAAQVVPLLPPNGASTVIVTGRSALTDLPGARHLHIDTLQPDDAERLLARIVGRDRVDLEPAEARSIVRLCGYLPLSIRIIGGRLLGRPSWPLRQLRLRLSDESRRLAEMRLGDLDLRASLDLSLTSLPPEALLAFDLFGLLGPHDVPGWVLGALLDRPDHERLLDLLVDAGLLQPARQDGVGQARYRMHDLVRAHARQRALDRGDGTCRAAVRRVVRTWERLVRHQRTGRPPSLFDPLDADPLDEPGAHGASPVALLARQLDGDAPAWLAAERQALLAAVRLAREWELAGPGRRLVSALACFYDEQALYDDWRTGHEVMLTCPGLDPADRGELLRGLGQVLVYTGDLEAAAGHFQGSVTSHRSAGQTMGAALALASLGTIHRLRGRLAQAEDSVRAALAVVVETGDAPKESLLRGSIGRVLAAQGRPAQARPWYDEALRLARECGDVHREAVTLRDLGSLEHESGRPGPAAAYLERSLALFRDLGDERCTAMTLLRRGPVLVDLADVSGARFALTEAARLFHLAGLWDEEDRCRSLLSDLDVELLIPPAP